MKTRQLIPFAIVLWLSLSAYGTASAHGHIEVGEYELTIGFHSEPALQGEPNGLDLFVAVHETGEPVNGLEDSLQAEISYGRARKTLRLRPQFGQDGAYTADLLLTEAGDYTFRIFGDIQGTPVDVSLTSGPDTFSPVEPKAAISFPGEEPSASALGASVDAAANAARLALLIGVVAAVFGVAGIAFGYLGYKAARRA
jgi:hypothetical protein